MPLHLSGLNLLPLRFLNTRGQRWFIKTEFAVAVPHFVHLANGRSFFIS